MQQTTPLSSEPARASDLLFGFQTRFPTLPWVALPLRLIVGYGFMEHGFAKLSRGLDAFPAILQAMGVPFPHVAGVLTIVVEIAGGFAVLVGAFIPVASVPMTIVLLTAMFTVHLQYGFSSIKLTGITAQGATFGPPGFETDLLYLACLAALVLGGSGPVSVDRLLAKKAGAGCDCRPSHTHPTIRVVTSLGAPPEAFLRVAPTLPPLVM